MQFPVKANVWKSVGYYCILIFVRQNNNQMGGELSSYVKKSLQFIKKRYTPLGAPELPNLHIAFRSKLYFLLL